MASFFRRFPVHALQWSCAAIGLLLAMGTARADGPEPIRLAIITKYKGPSPNCSYSGRNPHCRISIQLWLPDVASGPHAEECDLHYRTDCACEFGSPQFFSPRVVSHWSINAAI